MGAPLLELRGLTCRYRGVKAAAEVDLAVGEGEIVTLIGNNGSGKSTILFAVCGVLPAYASAEGSILFRGEEIRGLGSHDIVRRGISMVPEGRRIFPLLSVEENLLMGAHHRRLGGGDVERLLAAAYELFPLLGERRGNPGGGLSGGQQQMLAIGRALMAEPALLLLDEPSLGLAPLLVAEIFEIIREINRRGTAVLLVEQNARLALGAASRAYVLEKGRVALEGSRENMLGDKRVRDIYLGEGL
jgi:branched-chain amino acid transport system ATP-binding protein